VLAVARGARSDNSRRGVTVLALFLAWVLFAVIGRGALQHHRTGDTGFRLDRPGTRQRRVSQIAGNGGIAVGVIAPAAAIAGLAPVSILDRLGLRRAGVAIAVGGIGATVAAQLAMGDSWRGLVDPEERTVLVTSGPFAVVRNPIFTATYATLLGLTLALPNPVALAGLAMALIGLQLQVRLVEEPYLQATHGAEYEQYASRVGRFLPWVGRIRS
jgi:protein-S-isoprenylcysteine O-methyltransferase Ste14